QHLVHALAAVDHVTVVQAVALKFMLLSAWLEQPPRHRQAVSSAQTHHANPGLARGRGDGHDGVVVHQAIMSRRACPLGPDSWRSLPDPGGRWSSAAPARGGR